MEKETNKNENEARSKRKSSTSNDNSDRSAKKTKMTGRAESSPSSSSVVPATALETSTQLLPSPSEVSSGEIAVASSIILSVCTDPAQYAQKLELRTQEFNKEFSLDAPRRSPHSLLDLHSGMQRSKLGQKEQEKQENERKERKGSEKKAEKDEATKNKSSPLRLALLYNDFLFLKINARPFSFFPDASDRFTHLYQREERKKNQEKKEEVEEQEKIEEEIEKKEEKERWLRMDGFKASLKSQRTIFLQLEPNPLFEHLWDTEVKIFKLWDKELKEATEALVVVWKLVEKAANCSGYWDTCVFTANEVRIKALFSEKYGVHFQRLVDIIVSSQPNPNWSEEEKNEQDWRCVYHWLVDALLISPQELAIKQESEMSLYSTLKVRIDALIHSASKIPVGVIEYKSAVATDTTSSNLETAGISPSYWSNNCDRLKVALEMKQILINKPFHPDSMSFGLQFSGPEMWIYATKWLGDPPQTVSGNPNNFHCCFFGFFGLAYAKLDLFKKQINEELFTWIAKLLAVKQLMRKELGPKPASTYPRPRMWGETRVTVPDKGEKPKTSSSSSTQVLPENFVDSVKLQYDILSVLHQGRHVVLLGKDRTNQQEVAIKLTTPGEVHWHQQALEVVQGNGIVPILNILNYTEQGKERVALVLPHLRKLQRLSALTSREAQKQMIRLLEVVTDMHNKAGLLHQDIKKDNILIDERDQVFLADFELCEEPDSCDSEPSEDQSHESPTAHSSSLTVTTRDAQQDTFGLGQVFEYVLACVEEGDSLWNQLRSLANEMTNICHIGTVDLSVMLARLKQLGDGRSQ